ncbi:SWI/SNF-related matrix-associated actin-dependent regulator of chromatin subfamily C member 2, putative [Babesia caballi]|uniref:SWI/SNF-related matrix-associated actin-dependent regulator of chromatin subfamily C member 2, putative n=1 Tax=Babesia caballi TaxID=5871 RepID=A0AAV4LQK4_BABCB|nr:SWI/SNF-related matrix-associated actin-dependent regulator of chromatin subfamily C member 2, putative [Babesia caballi]
MSVKRNVFAEFMRLNLVADDAEDTKDLTATSDATPTFHWFNENDLNDVEREYVANIFQSYGTNMDDAKNYYIDIRSQIMNLYHKDPAKYLTSRHCVESIRSFHFAPNLSSAGADPSTIAKVYCILNYWGLINYAAVRREIDALLPAEDQRSDAQTSHEITGDILITDVNNSSIDEIDAINAPFTQEKCVLDRKPTKEQAPQRRCHTCQAPCKYLYYMIEELSVDSSLEKFRDCVWCSKCYANTNYPLQVPKRSLINIMVPVGTSVSMHPFVPTKWNRTRRERLYNAIDKFGLNWRMIKEEMGNEVTVRECMYHFVIAPLERETHGFVRLPVCFSDVDRTNVPFFASPNTITAFLSFCASTLSPIVASRAAKALLDHVLEGGTNSEEQVQAVTDRGATQRQDTGDISPSIAEGLPTNTYSFGDNRKEADGTMLMDAQNSGRHKVNTAGARNSIPVNNGQHWESMNPNPTVTDAALFKGFRRAVQASVDACSELAAMEQGKIDKVLYQIIDLKIKHIEEKMRQHAITNEQMDNCGIKMVRFIFLRPTFCRGWNCPGYFNVTPAHEENVASVSTTGRARQAWRDSILRARLDIFGSKTGMPGEEEWLKPLRGHSRTRWYWPSKYLHMDFSLRHYLAMQLKRREAKQDHPSINQLWDTVKLFNSHINDLERFMGNVNEETFRKSTTLQDAHAMLYMITKKSPLRFQFSCGLEDDTIGSCFEPFSKYALRPLNGEACASDAADHRKKRHQFRQMIAQDPNIVRGLQVRNRFVDALYLRRRAYYLEKLSRKKPVSETIQKYRKHFTVHPDHKALWPDNKGISQHSWPSK